MLVVGMGALCQQILILNYNYLQTQNYIIKFETPEMEIQVHKISLNERPFTLSREKRMESGNS